MNKKRSRIRLTFKCSYHRFGTKPRKKLDVARLKSVDIQRQLENKMDEVIKEPMKTTHNVEQFKSNSTIVFQDAFLGVWLADNQAQ